MGKPHNNSVLGVVPARGGSKRIPGKNIKEFLGKPLIAWSIEAAKAAAVMDRVIVSTDDMEIAEIGRNFGAEVPFIRPPHLAKDTTPTLPVIGHALQWLRENEGYEPRWVVLLEPSSPGRQPKHIREAVSLLSARSDADSVCGVSELPGHFSPLKALNVDARGVMTRYPDSEPIKNLVHRNQDLPNLYYINSAIYALKTENIMGNDPSFWGNTVLAYPMEARYALDIDTPDDWVVAEAKMKALVQD